MLFHAIYHPDTRFCVIRDAAHGLTDFEFQHGCRKFGYEHRWESHVYTAADTEGFEILTANQWSEFIYSFDESASVPSNFFINSRPIRDKWDTNREIY